jgi:hypothetical protein
MPDTDEDRQLRLVAALRRGGVLGPGAVELIETHISRVLLAGNLAWKIKKPVNPGFLDFSTLAARRHFCREELRLNRRLAPDIYLGVDALCGSPEAPILVGDGQIAAEGAFEYAVKMARFPQDRLADRMLAAGELCPEHLDQLARTLARFHEALPRAGANDGHGTPERINAPMRRNVGLIREALGAAPDTRLLDELEAWSEKQFAELAPLMARRREQGFVRECHGDLHLGNIAVLADGVRVFDGIEFNPELRWIDIESEVAFLVMDCTSRGRADLGWRFLDGWLSLTGDYAGLALWRWYAVYRALVRGMVALLRAGQLLAEAREAAWADGLSHLHLAHRLAHPAPPVLILTHGFSGSGKTTAAQALVQGLPALRLRSDVERKRLFGLAPEARSGSPLDGGLYREDATRATYAELERLTGLILSAGHSAIVDAGFLLRGQRDGFRALARARGLPCLILDCRATKETLRRRIALRAEQGRDASEATSEVLAHQWASAEALTAEELAVTVAVDLAQLDGPEIVRRVVDRVRGMAG